MGLRGGARLEGGKQGTVVFIQKKGKKCGVEKKGDLKCWKSFLRGTLTKKGRTLAPNPDDRVEGGKRHKENAPKKKTSETNTKSPKSLREEEDPSAKEEKRYHQKKV